MFIPNDLLLACLLISTSALPSASADMPGGIPSRYSTPLARALPMLHWSSEHTTPEHSPEGSAFPIRLTCYDTPDDRLYIGARQEMRIHAPLTAARSVIDDFNHYPDLFDGMVKAEVREKSGNRFVLFSEQEIPFPFVANERDEVIYSEDDSQMPRRLTYLYQLRKSNHLIANDGAIILESLADGDTAYLELDFWNANWGIAKTFAPGRVWRENIEGLAQTDLAIKARAEHLDRPVRQALDDSKQAVKGSLATQAIDACLNAKTEAKFSEARSP